MKKSLILILSIFILGSLRAQMWNLLASGTTNDLLSVDFHDAMTGWVVGENGVIRKTDNGGLTWTAQSSGTSFFLYSTYFIDVDTGLAVGDAGTILRTINGGTTWNSITGIPADYRIVWFLDENIGFIGGGDGSNSIILKTTDGGATWVSLITGTTEMIYGLYFTDALTGYASGNFGLILKTTNGGNSWTPQASGVAVLLDYVHFTDSNTGYISGDSGTVLKTINAGVSWTPLSTGTSDRFICIKFTDTNTGYASGGNVGGSNAGSIYRTTDGGLSWTPAASDLNRLYRSVFPGEGVGYCTGLNGTILKVEGLNVGITESADIQSVELYPNPLNSFVVIGLDLKQESFVNINVRDLSGKECLMLMNGNLKQGKHQLIFSELDILPTGTYFIVIEQGNSVHSKKLIKQ